LGQGGFGITYLAEDTVLETSVCIKELFVSGNSTRNANHSVMSTGSKEFSFDDFKQRFIQEARQLAKFRHPSIVRVLDFFDTNNTAYVVMEYIEGKTLKEFTIEHGFVSQDLAIPIIKQLLDAVEEVHNMGMLHRDIKPDNILLTPRNSICLIDFGSAREFREGMTMTQTAMLTPGYAPMEQYSNRSKRGTFTDIYALGATMYFMLTGEKPLAATDRFTEEMHAPHLLNSAISSQISSAVMLAMQMKPEERFQNVQDFREAITMLVGSNIDKVLSDTTAEINQQTDYSIQNQSKNIDEEKKSMFLEKTTKIEQSSANENIQKKSYALKNLSVKDFSDLLEVAEAFINEHNYESNRNEILSVFFIFRLNYSISKDSIIKNPNLANQLLNYKSKTIDVIFQKYDKGEIMYDLKTNGIITE
jgi:serine/threonine protein kinase